MDPVEHIDSLMPEVEASETPPDLPEADVSTDAPADKQPRARADDGKFKGEKADAKKEAEAKQPEQKVEPKVEKPSQTVPLAVLLEERNARKQRDAEFEKLRAELEGLKNPPKVPAAAPAFETDPKGYTDHKVQSALAELEATKKTIEQAQETAQQSQQQTEQLQFSQHLEAAERAFVKETPDYYEALGHVRNIRANQLRLLAPGISDEQIGQQIGREEMQLAMQLARENRNPIATVYQLAQQFGYSRKAPAEALELPKVPGQRQLPPDQTLGSGAGGGGGGDEKEDQPDPFDQAFGEMFGRRKAS